MSWSIFLVGVASLATMRAALERGDLDEAARQGALAGPAVVERGLASRDRATQLAAIVAAPVVEARAELLAPLARVAEGPDRRTAIPAARAARTIARELGRRARPDDLADDDLATWRAAWAALALRDDRWIELRKLALDTAAALDPAGTGVELTVALRDPDPAFRLAAATIAPLPVAAAHVPALAAAVVEDPDGDVATGAAQTLCASLPTTPVLAALGPAGIARIRALATAERIASSSLPALRDAARCLDADGSPESIAAARQLRARR